MTAPPVPRVRPGTRREIGPAAAAFAALAGRVAGTGPPAIFTTLARHRRLFWRWLWFAAALMPRGRLPRVDTELVILRVAHLCDCPYEADHHRRLGRRAGLTDADLARVAEGPEGAGWSERQTALLRAVDELQAGQRVGDEAWTALSSHLPVEDRIELCLLVGHYVMIAGTLNSLGIAADPPRRGGAPRR